MNKKEIITRILRNKNNKREAIRLIADFLVIRKAEAEQIWKDEVEGRF